jgi:nicotinamide-nucleotide amidase
MDAVIVSIGSELTRGQQVDTNAGWLSAELTRLGVSVVTHLTVGDELPDIRAAIGWALKRADLVITTGGLGPTPDDLTRHAVAEQLGQPLEENAAALEQIRTMFERWQRELSESNLVQALIPRGCEVVPNPCGSAPGIRFSGDRSELFALPGVPTEMRNMFRAAVVPVVDALTSGTGGYETKLQCFGISEARIGELLGDLMSRGRNPLVGTAAARAIISVTVAARGKDATQARRLAEQDVAEIRSRLGLAVFGEGDATLEKAVADLLEGQHQTLATAESCTGGLLAKRLTDIPGSSRYFLWGCITYSNEAKTDLLNVPEELIKSQGAVSESVAQAMASGCRTAAGSDFALSVTGIAGPTGGSPPGKPVGLVYVGLAGPNGDEVKRFLMGEHFSRGFIRDRACSAALNLLRLHLLRAAET